MYALLAVFIMEEELSIRSVSLQYRLSYITCGRRDRLVTK